MEKKKLINFFCLSLLFIIILIFLLYDSNKLGFFADDISLINGLIKVNNISEIITFNKYFDAGRELQPVWMWLFLNIVKIENVESIHFIQCGFYFVNSILFFYILNLLKFKKTTSSLVWIYFLFFPLFAGVGFWVHNLSMTLISTFFFIIFLILNIKLYSDDSKFHLFKELLIVLFALLSIFTYEQSLYVIYAIILLRFFFKNKININKNNIIIILIHSLIIIFFSIYKLAEMERLMLEEISFDLNSIIYNLLVSFNTPIKSFFVFEYSLTEFTLSKYFIFIIFIILAIYVFNNFSKTNSQSSVITNKKILYKIFLCTILYIISFFPLFFHYISPRHFYLPGIFMMIGIAYLVDFLIKHKISTKLSRIFLIILLFFNINNALNYNFIKNSQIQNYKIKLDFYSDLKEKINIKQKVINLINFPNKYDKSLFFAHEQSETFQFIFNNKNLPLITINSDDPTLQKIIFLQIADKKIIYKIVNN